MMSLHLEQLRAAVFVLLSTKLHGARIRQRNCPQAKNLALDRS